ncbi:MAG TPA: hypothetical protein VGI81_19445 [Tepidisphaeraceae bacterium]
MVRFNHGPHIDPLEFQAAFFKRYPLAEQVMGLFDALPNVSFYAQDRLSRFVKVNRPFLEHFGLHDEPFSEWRDSTRGR